MTMTREQAIRNYVEHLIGDDLANLLQHMTSYDGCFEEATYFDMDEFDELLDGYTPLEIASMMWFGDFNPNKDYWRFDAYGHLVSLDWGDIVDEVESLESDIIDHLVHYYSGDTPWVDLDYLVAADNDTLFNEDFEEVGEENQ